MWTKRRTSSTQTPEKQQITKYRCGHSISAPRFYVQARRILPFRKEKMTLFVPPVHPSQKDILHPHGSQTYKAPHPKPIAPSSIPETTLLFRRSTMVFLCSTVLFCRSTLMFQEYSGSQHGL